VFLSSGEYRDLIQCCSCSCVQQLVRSTADEPSQPVLDYCTNREVVDDISVNKCLSVAAAVSDSIMSDCGHIGDDSCNQTNDDSAEMLLSSNTGLLIQQQAQHTVTQDAAAVPKLSALSGDVAPEICNDPANAQPPGSVVTVVNSGNGRKVARSTSINDDGVFGDAHHGGIGKNQPIPLELYIQGNSQTVFLLFMHQGSLSELDVVKDLVLIFCSVYHIIYFQLINI